MGKQIVEQEREKNRQGEKAIERGKVKGKKWKEKAEKKERANVKLSSLRQVKYVSLSQDLSKVHMFISKYTSKRLWKVSG